MTDEGARAAPEKVRVALGARAYDIFVGPQLIARAADYLSDVLKRPRVAIITDETVAKLHLPALETSLDAAGIRHSHLALAPGEQTKCFAELERVSSFLLDQGIERSDMVIALGGGVIGDLTGFAASILRRGVDFVQIPTTLLSQVDSSVGGKTGINTPHGKNLIGAFHQPRLVLADISALETLSEREFLAGYAEVVKYGLINDRDFFDWLEANLEALKNGDAGTRSHAIVKSCQAKADVVAEDEKEGGVRALLNLGHTFGHALEAATHYDSKRLVHGEAVAVGMVMAFEFSAMLGLCPGQDAQRVKAHLKRAGLPVSLEDIPGDLPDAETMIGLMAQDKKVVDGRLTFILARGIGESFITRDVETGDLKRFLSAYEAA